MLYLIKFLDIFGVNLGYVTGNTDTLTIRLIKTIVTFLMTITATGHPIHI